LVLSYLGFLSFLLSFPFFFQKTGSYFEFSEKNLRAPKFFNIGARNDSKILYLEKFL